MTVISNRPVHSPSTPTARTEARPEERTQAPEAPQQAQDPRVRDWNRDTFEPAATSPAGVVRHLNPTGRARVTTEGGNVVLQAQGSITPTGVSTPRGGVRVPGGQRLGLNFESRFEASVRVQVPAAAATDSIRRGEIPNPANPESWPIGTRASAELQGRVQGGGMVGRAMRGIRGALGLSAEVERTGSQRYEIERVNAETVRATVTTRETQNDTTGIRGFRASQRQELERSRSADFNITTPEGREAYQRFLRTGELPTAEGPGVSNIRSADRHSSERDEGVGNRPVVGANEQVRVTTTGEGSQIEGRAENPGLGSIERNSSVGPEGGSTRTDINGIVTATTVTQPGQEPSRSYQFTFRDPQAAQIARMAFTGEVGAGNGGPATVNLNEQQIRDLVNRLSAGQGSGGDRLAQTPEALNHALRALTANGERELAMRLYGLTVAPGSQALPSTSVQ